jgi:acyl-CoA reductase-like NAD-dependent aldehyde dehydrogenase
LYNKSLKYDVIKYPLSTTSNNDDSKKIKTINPVTEDILKEYDIISNQELNNIIKKSRNAFLVWKDNIHRCEDSLYAFANEFRKNKESLSKTATLEIGKAIKESRSEVEKCAWAMEYFADHGKMFTNGEVINTDARKSIIKFQPLGVIGSITPWNFPY